MRWLWTRAARTASAHQLQRFVHSAAVVALRPYQEECLRACTDALSAGQTRIGISLPTGAGKTTVFISLLARLPSPTGNPKATKSLIIVNSVELARQSAEQVAKLFPSWTVEIEQGVKHQATGAADVTVATYQTLLQRERLRKIDPLRLKAIVVDEAHHAAAPSYRRILAHFDPDIRHPDKEFVQPNTITHKIPVIGFSATFSRHDGLALGSVFERIVYHRSFLEMIKEEWLCDVRFTSVHARLKLNEVTVSARTGDFNAASLARVVNTPTVNDLVVKTWLHRAAQRKSTLVFCVSIAHVESLTQTFRSYGIDARYVYSGTPAAERRALIAAFKAGEFPVLINCAILTEGADIPNIDCVVVARPTRSRNVFAQMIGRGMRLSPSTGKKDCHIIDFVDTQTRVQGVMSTPTLFGLDPDEIIEGELKALEERAAGNKDLSQFSASADGEELPEVVVDVEEPTSITYRDHENPFSTVHGASGDPHIAALSPYAWVSCGNDVYVMECMASGHIRITKSFSECNLPFGDEPVY
ncbi:P-loop containing nucleoside triphosphate hydrolase protein [Schizophyllum amplum]|uniref:P-loop containing nucleoside triphosphate hydrolase protein n=1 Tax=Schizophyllum amplum TaxID=97359 RepID=A0A550C5X6_9AGAR|nr:P-loop containing nucleoside triphosphate hydrolase protein [Auriculariopsis ampla]